jgi:hypothetical protein
MIGSDGFTGLISGALGGRRMAPADYIQVMAERIVEGKVLYEGS